jgi:hypothetical protein
MSIHRFNGAHFGCPPHTLGRDLDPFFIKTSKITHVAVVR